MKKTLVMLLMSLVTLTAYSQDYKDSDYYYYDGIENHKNMGISSEQKTKIIAIKKSIGRRHTAIGKDRLLRGYEKGQAHRDLNKTVRTEIYDVLNSTQRSNWDDREDDDKNHKKRLERYDNIEEIMDALEDKIDELEDDYEDRIDAVGKDKSLSKAERKEKEQFLKDQLKTKKKKLKKEKQSLKDSIYKMNIRIVTSS